MNIEWITTISEGIKFIIIATAILVVLLVLARWIFGDSLKKLGIRVSPREGIGIDIETHLRQIAISVPKPKPITPVQIAIDAEIDEIRPDRNDLLARAINASDRFNGQRVPVSLFGFDYNHSYLHEQLSYYRLRNGTVARFREYFILPKFTFVGLIPKSQGVLTRIYAGQNNPFGFNSFGTTFGFSHSPVDGKLLVRWPKMRRMLVICEMGSIPEGIQSQWIDKIVSLKKSLNQETILWVIYLGNKNSNMTNKLRENLILFTDKNNFEALENILMISSITPKTS